MPLLSRHRRTPEDCFQRLRRSKSPLELTKSLLSGQPFTDKVKILLAIPDSACKKRVWMRELESTLEDAGYIELAQVVRWRVFLNRDGDRGVFLRWSQNLIQADIEARWIVQGGNLWERRFEPWKKPWHSAQMARKQQTYPTSSTRIKRSSRNWISGIGSTVGPTGNSRVACQVGSSSEGSKPVERTRIGICQHGYARTALAAAGAVDAAADAVRNPGRQNVHGVEGTAPVRVAAACARPPTLRVGHEMIWQTFHSM